MIPQVDSHSKSKTQVVVSMTMGSGIQAQGNGSTTNVSRIYAHTQIKNMGLDNTWCP